MLIGWQLGRTRFGGLSTRPLLKDSYDPCVDDEVSISTVVFINYLPFPCVENNFAVE